MSFLKPRLAMPYPTTLTELWKVPVFLGVIFADGNLDENI
jgi:hypothetical protein